MFISVLSELRRLVPVLGLAALLQLPAAPVQAQAPAWAWARNATVTPGNLIIPVRVAADASGNSYVLGQFTGTVTLGSTTLVSAGDTDLFLAKLDPAGTYLWAQRLGGAGPESAGGVAVDATGNVVVTGIFAQTMVLGSTTLVASSFISFESGFVAKLSAAGTWQWAQRYGTYFGSSSSLRRPSVAVTPGGDVLLAGTFNTTTTTGIGSFDLGPTTLVTAGNFDLFVARLDGATGAWRWAVRGGGTENDEGLAVCSDAAGNAVVSGSFTATAPFGSTTLTAVGGTDALVVRLDPIGQWQWASGGGGPANDAARAVAVDRAGNPVLAGSFRNTATFGASSVNSIGVDDVLVAKLSSTGQWQWAARGGGGGFDYGYGVATDAQNNVYVGGGVSIQSDFGSTVLNPGSTPVSSAFAGRLSSAGAWQWAVGAGNAGFSSTLTLGFALDAAGNVFLVSRYQDTATLGPFSLNSGGQFQDAGYIGKLGNTPLATHSGSAALALAPTPNPVAPGGALTLPAAGQVELRDALGRLVLDQSVTMGGQPRLTLPASLVPGIYQVRLRTATALHTGKLVVE